jgi:hypothetical protein
MLVTLLSPETSLNLNFQMKQFVKWLEGPVLNRMHFDLILSKQFDWNKYVFPS